MNVSTILSPIVAHYRDVLVAVKEFKARKFGRDNMKKEVRHEAKMISHLEDHRGVTLLFGVSLQSSKAVKTSV